MFNGILHTLYVQCLDVGWSRCDESSPEKGVINGICVNSNLKKRRTGGDNSSVPSCMYSLDAGMAGGIDSFPYTIVRLE